MDAPKPYDWKSAEGLAIQAKELMDQKLFTEAGFKLKESLLKDPYDMLALVKSAEMCIRNGDFSSAFAHAKKAISFDAHHAAANYYYGLSAVHLGKIADAYDGFSIASMGVEFRSSSYVEIAKLHAQKSNWPSVLDYCEKALDYNNANATAIALKIIALRKLGNIAQSKALLDALGATQPLNLFYKWETALASNKSLTSPSFKNELPEESFLEMASFYSALGLVEESTKVLGMLSNHPLALYSLAYIKREDAAGSMQLLNKANALPTLMVFPFRTEHLPVLQWAAQKSGHWKAQYYLALLLHDKNRQEEAFSIMQSLNDKPDEAHVYALRSLWNKADIGKKEADLNKAMLLDAQSWRYPKLLVQHFIQEKEFEKALTLSRKYKKEHTGNNYIMDMLFAKSLLLNKQYKSCDSLLSLMDIIPFEGATDGRGLYWEAKMMQALQAMKNGKYKIALTFIKQAGEWPENLGVGKPYDTDIDSRLEQFFLYKCLLQLKQKDAANEQLDKIIAFKSGVYNTIRNFQPANNLVTKWAIDAKRSPLDWNGWMKEEIEKYPQFKDIFQWVLDAGNGTSLGDSKTLVLDPWMRVIQEYRANFNGL